MNTNIPYPFEKGFTLGYLAWNLRRSVPRLDWRASQHLAGPGLKIGNSAKYDFLADWLPDLIGERIQPSSQVFPAFRGGVCLNAEKR
jgi:hypothetical protein